jgi:hypothetical protein
VETTYVNKNSRLMACCFYLKGNIRSIISRQVQR